MKTMKLAVAGLALGFVSLGAAHACTMNPSSGGGGGGNVGSTTPSWDWRVQKSASPIPGFRRQEFYMNIGLFGPSAPTTCACGLGYSGAPLSGIVPLDASLVLYDSATDTQVPYSTFPTLFPNAGATGAFNANPGGAGLNWFGFSSAAGAVPPISSVPGLGGTISLQICFKFDVPNFIDSLFKQRLGFVLGSEAGPDGTPLSFPNFPHGLNPNEAPYGPGSPVLPAPGSAALLALTGLVIGCHRRR